MSTFYFYEREEDGGVPAGLTVSKRENLPDGDFRITEHTWPSLTLWFLDDDEFSADEREGAYRAFLVRAMEARA